MARHYDWLLRGRFRQLLIGTASMTTQPLRVDWTSWRIVFRNKDQNTRSGWMVRDGTRNYHSICLRGNAKQRRQQRRAIERFLKREQQKGEN